MSNIPDRQTILDINDPLAEQVPLVPSLNLLLERQPSVDSRNFDNLHAPDAHVSQDSLYLNQPLFQPVEGRTDLDGQQLLECFQKFPDIDTGSYRFNLFSKELGSLTGLTFNDLKLDIPQLLKSDCFWLDIHLPQNEELQVLEEGLDIHMLTVEDILTSNTREKCEVFPNYYYVVVKGYIDDEDTSTIKPLPMHLLVFQKCIITVLILIVSFPRK